MEHSLDKKEIRALLAYCSREEYRTNLTQVALWELESGSALFGATDGHTAVLFERAAGHAGPMIPPPRGPEICIPRQMLVDAAKLLKPLTVAKIYQDADGWWLCVGASRWQIPSDPPAFPPLQHVWDRSQWQPRSNTICLNSRYLARFALCSDADGDKTGFARVEVHGELNPIELSNDRWRALAMPMRR